MDYISHWKQKGEYGEIRIARMLIRKQKRKNLFAKSHICSCCRRGFSHVISLKENPYHFEFGESSFLERLCDDCYEAALGDI